MTSHNKIVTFYTVSSPSDNPYGNEKEMDFVFIKDYKVKTEVITMNTQNINDKFQSLPGYLKREVLDYIEFLTKRYKIQHKKNRFTFEWEGGLKELKEQFNPVDLQHKAKDYR